MFMHNKRLMYTVRVGAPDPKLANLILEQFGGPDGELAAAMRYFTQGLAELDPGRKDLLLDIAIEEISHLEVVGSIVTMLNRGVKGQMARRPGGRRIIGEHLRRHRQSHDGAALWRWRRADQFGGRSVDCRLCRWNQGEQWDFVEDRAKQAAVDGGDGSASVKLSRADMAIAKKVAARTMSDPASDPTTGAELGQRAAS